MKHVRHLFIIIFLSLLLLPLIYLDTKSTASTSEKRNLAPFPELFKENTIKINSEIFQQVDAYFNDRFGFRERLVHLNADLKYKALNDSGNDRAIIGKNGWLYYIFKPDGDNFSDFMKSNLVDDATIIKFANQIKYRGEWCKKNNITFIFIIAPNKHNVYPEYYPIERPSGITRTDQFLNYLDKHRIEYLYPRDLLISKKNKDTLLYYKTGTHWNTMGAYYAYNLILEDLHKKLPKTKFPDLEYEVNVNTDSGGGDITPMLGLESVANNTGFQYKPKGKNWTDFYSYIKNEGGFRAFTTEGKDKSLPYAIIFRDSFFSALKPFTSTLFSKADYRWKMFDDTDKDYILANKPNIIIWEVVERYTGIIPTLTWNN